MAMKFSSRNLKPNETPQETVSFVPPGGRELEPNRVAWTEIASSNVNTLRGEPTESPVDKIVRWPRTDRQMSDALLRNFGKRRMNQTRVRRRHRVPMHLPQSMGLPIATRALNLSFR